MKLILRCDGKDNRIIEQMLDTLHYKELSEHVNTKFRVTEMDEPIELELVEAVEVQINSRQEAFSLIFLGPKDPILPQKTYHLAHEKLGSGPIFLVPIGQNEEGIRYEAAFNRLIENGV